MSLTKLTVEDFSEQLASSSPTPGGGSASALAGAMAAAMVEMACNRERPQSHRGREAQEVNASLATRA